MEGIRKYFNHTPHSGYFPTEHLQTIFRISVKFSLQFSSDTSVYKARVILSKHELARWDLNDSLKISFHRQDATEKNYCNASLGMQSSTSLRVGYQHSVRNKPCSLQENSMSLGSYSGVGMQIHFLADFTESSQRDENSHHHFSDHVWAANTSTHFADN